MSLVMNAMTHPTRLYWWQWGKITGFFLPLLFFCFNIEHSGLWALAAHFLLDFSFQSGETAVGKARGDWRILAYHAFISGGYAGLVAGGLTGLALSIAVHFLVDSTNKFGLAEPVGPILDQSAHIITVAIICWLL